MIVRLTTYLGFLELDGMKREKNIFSMLTSKAGLNRTGKYLEETINKYSKLRELHKSFWQNKDLFSYVQGNGKEYATKNVPSYEHLDICVERYINEEFGRGWKSWFQFIHALKDPVHSRF